MSRRSCSLLLISAAAFVPPPATCRAATALTTPPVDYSLYREGEVRRVERRFGGWLLTCDEIRRLGQKFCSLRTVARSADGTIVASMTVSTDDRGMPAAVMTLPFGTSLTTGTRISFSPPAKPIVAPSKRRADAGRQALRPVGCDGTGCQIVWAIPPGDIRKMRSGQALRLSFDLTRTPQFPSLSVAVPRETITGTVDVSGFSEALEASLH